MRSEFLQEIIKETPFCVEYKVRKMADRLINKSVLISEFEKVKNYSSSFFTNDDWKEFDEFEKNKSKGNNN